MAETSLPLVIPTVDRVVRWNRRLIAAYGGEFSEPDNLLSSGSLNWVLDAIGHSVFGFDPYPTIPHKAALVARTIIAGHVFFDGNKRTGMFAAARILEVNGYTYTATQDEVIQIALEVAAGHAGSLTMEDLVEWFTAHSRPM